MARLGWTAGALAGSVIAGLGVTAVMIGGERASGDPSELIALQRASARRLGRATAPDEAMPTPGEQAVAQGGHLALSALAGLAYAAVTDEDTPVVASGLLFGAAFYVLAHVVAGPALGVKDAEWRQPPAVLGRHVLVHALFGLITAAGAKAGAAFTA